MKMLQSINAPIEGRHAVVLGRSNMVGKPMAMLLLASNATVTIAHSKTRELASHTRAADILVAAVGRRNLVTADMVKPGAVVIDVGTNRTVEGKLAGDVDFDNVKQLPAGFRRSRWRGAHDNPMLLTNRRSGRTRAKFKPTERNDGRPSNPPYTKSAKPLLDSPAAALRSIQPADVTPGIEELLTERGSRGAYHGNRFGRHGDSVIEPLNKDRPARALVGAVSHMNAWSTHRAARAIHGICPSSREFWTELPQNEALYGRFKALAAAPDFAQWPDVRRKVLENELRDFRLGAPS